MKKRLLTLLIAFAAIATGAWAFTPNSYFLTGSIAGWGLNSDYELTMVQEGLYKITDVELTTSDLLKVVKSNNNGTTIGSWYPDGMDNNQTVDENGTYTIYFRPAGDGTAAEGYAYIPHEGDGSGLEPHGCTNGGYMFKFVKQSTIHETQYETACDYFFWHGTTYTASGEYTYDTGTDIYKLNLTIHYSTSKILEREVIIGQHFNEGPFDFDVTADTPLTQTETITNVAGCDSVITLNLTIKKLEDYYYDGVLGFIYSPDITTFKLWEPTATSVKLNRYATGTDSEAGAQSYGSIEMEKLMDGSNWTGVWTCTIAGDIKGSYYTYSVNGEEIADPWSLAVGFDGKRSMVFDSWDVEPSGWDGDSHVFCDDEYKKIEYIDVAAFSADPTCGVSEGHRGKYLALTETNTTYENAGEVPTCMNKLFTENYQAIILTMTAPQTVPDQYSTNPYDGATVIDELRQAVMAAHTLGLAVYVRFDFSTIPVHEVLRKRYILETCQYWVNEFHADGIVLATDINAETKALTRDMLNNIDTRIILATDDEIDAMQTPDGIAIDETNFPDATFRSYISDRFDTSRNGYLSDEEIAAVINMDIDASELGAKVKKLKGIEYFTELTTLWCMYHQLTELDVSMLTKLQELRCLNNQLQTLKLGKAVQIVSCDYNQLQTIDFSECSELAILSCRENQLQALDLSNCPKIFTVDCRENQISDALLSSGITYESIIDDMPFHYEMNQLKDEKMDAFIASLPDFSAKETLVPIVMLSEKEGEGNGVTEEQAAAAKAKGWMVYIQNQSEDYEKYTGISEVNRDIIANDRYYTLDGRRVERLTKGVYIVNGRKVIK